MPYLDTTIAPVLTSDYRIEYTNGNPLISKAFLYDYRKSLYALSRSGTNSSSALKKPPHVPFIPKREYQFVTTARMVVRNVLVDRFYFKKVMKEQIPRLPRPKKPFKVNGIVQPPKPKFRTLKRYLVTDRSRMYIKSVWIKQRVLVYTKRLVPKPMKHGKKTKAARRPKRFTVPNALDYRYVRVTSVTSPPIKATKPTPAGYTRLATGMTGTMSFPSTWGAQIAKSEDAIFTNRASQRFSVEYAALKVKAANKCRDKIKRQSVNLANVAVEARKTVDMIGSLASRLARLLLLVKRGRLLAASKFLFPNTAKEMANEWLLFQYGILPLIKDIQGLVDEIKTYASKSRKVRYVATATYDIKEREDFSTTSGIKSVGYYSSTGKLVVKYRLEATVTDKVLEDLNRLGITNLATGAWEAIPFSFVVDWFLPIGNFLNRLDALQGWTVSNVTMTTFSKVKHKYVRHIGGTSSDGWTWEDATIGWELDNVECKREILSSLPSMPFPSFKSPLSTLHIANAIALLIQLRK